MQNLRDILLIQKRELDQFDTIKYIKRDIELKKDIIKVIIGPRRVGKSFYTIHELKKSDNFGYVNFDDEN